MPYFLFDAFHVWVTQYGIGFRVRAVPHFQKLIIIFPLTKGIGAVRLQVQAPITDLTVTWEDPALDDLSFGE